MQWPLSAQPASIYDFMTRENNAGKSTAEFKAKKCSCKKTTLHWKEISVNEQDLPLEPLQPKHCGRF